MIERTGWLRRELLSLGVEGLAIRRDWLEDPDSLVEREQEIRVLLNEPAVSARSATPVYRHTPTAGYASWSATYDAQNPLISAEEPIVRDILARLNPSDALDAACGTGRYAVVLEEFGHRVIGVDASQEMLDVARRKVRGADLRTGSLDALPVADSSIGVAVCALALTHLERLDPAIAEFARVVRSGGTLVISDVHPVLASLGGGAVFQVEEGDLAVHYVPNHVHQLSSYLSTFRVHGFEVLDCREPLVDEGTLGIFLGLDRWPDALRRAFVGLPFLLVWRVRRL